MIANVGVYKCKTHIIANAVAKRAARKKMCSAIRNQNERTVHDYTHTISYECLKQAVEEQKKTAEHSEKANCNFNLIQFNPEALEIIS